MSFTDTLNRPGPNDMAGALLGGRTDQGERPPVARLDFAKVEELLIAGQWVAIKRGSLAGSLSSLQWFGGPAGFLAFVRSDGKTGAVRVDAIQGFSPLAEDDSPPQRSVVVQGRRPVVAVNPTPSTEDGPFITSEEAKEARFLAADYEKAAIRSNAVDAARFTRMADEQRRRAALPVRDAEPDLGPELDTGSPISDSLLEPPKKP
jgi:hypothetical protein